MSNVRGHAVTLPRLERARAGAWTSLCVLALLAVLAARAARADGGARVVVTGPAPPPSPAVKSLPASFDGAARVDLPQALPAQPAALGCGTPITTGTVTATHPYYDVFVDAYAGSFTARTGASHSVTALAGSPQNVIFGGETGGPGTSDIAWRFHDQGITYSDPGNGAACVFDPPDTLAEPASTGIEQEFTVTPAPGITCTLRSEIVAFGTTEADSGVRLTLATTNSPASVAAVNVGVRWQIDYQNASDDGPIFATVTCDPPAVDTQWSTEHDLLSSEIRDFYRIQNNTGSPIFSNVTSTTSIGGIPDTGTPDRLVYGYWGSMVSSRWDYVTSEGSSLPDSDSAVLWYHGYLPADGDLIAPGETRRHSVVIFTSADNVDCGTFIPGCATQVASPPRDQSICLGDDAVLDGSGVTITDCSGSVDATWTDGVSSWPGSVVLVTPSDTTTYQLAVTCSTDPTCRADFAARVTVDRPPDFRPPIIADPDPCNSGIKLSWNDAVFYGGAGGAYAVYRSAVSCADALLQPPLASGLPAPGFFDQTTVTGQRYHYVVDAEAASPGTPCAPQGPNGGAVTRLCETGLDDMEDLALIPGPGGVLRARRRGDEITLLWPGLRALQAGEHLHLNKSLDARSVVIRVNPEGDVSGSYSETDTSAWLQFFDLRIANACERLSLPDYPYSSR